MTKRQIDAAGYEFNLGDEVKDKVTGYKGIVTCRAEWLYGCRRYTVQSKQMKDGKAIDSMHLDEMAIKLIKPAPRGAKIQQTGGPQDEPPRARDASR